MNDLFGKVLGSILGKATGGKASAPSGGGIGGDVLGGLLTNVLGKDGSNMNAVVKRLASAGLTKIVKSWIAKGPNQLISADEVSNGLGIEQIDSLAKQYGIPKDQIAKLLAEYLPDAVDQMTPEGELPGGEVIDLTPKE